MDPLSQVFAALADPTRRAILERLADRQAPGNQLAEPFAMSPQAVSKHLKVLEAAGLISRGKDAQYRPARINGERLGTAAAWLDDYRVFWEGSFDCLDAHLKSLIPKEKKP